MIINFITLDTYINPAETGFYYLNSRYYDAEVGRFVNEDKYIDTGIGFVGFNMFAYCNNNPIIFSDEIGTRPILSASLAEETPMQKALAFDYMNKRNSVVDMTTDLNKFMKHNAKVFEEYIEENGTLSGALFFYKNVTDGGALDIKLQEEWQFQSSKKYFYQGQKLRYDDSGNINFGYVGAVLFPLNTLCFGAGLNQIKKWGFEYGDFSTFFDDPRDNEMIRLGFDLYTGGIYEK